MNPVKRLSATKIERTERLWKFFDTQEEFHIKKKHGFSHDYDCNFWKIQTCEKYGMIWKRRKTIAILYVNTGMDYATISIQLIEYEADMYKFAIAMDKQLNIERIDLNVNGRLKKVFIAMDKQLNIERIEVDFERD